MNPADVAELDKRPFDGMRIEDSSALDLLDGRSACERCFKSRKYFCYSCYLPVPELKGRLPNVQLPVKIDIIKHRHEIDGKSTAAHAAILAPDHVTVYTYPDVPDYTDEKGVYLVYPSAKSVPLAALFDDGDSVRLEELEERLTNCTLLKERLSMADDTVQSLPALDRLPIHRAIFIDSTWNQSRGIYKDERLKSLPCVVIQSRHSQFWRHQKGSPRWYLATVEAIHQFALETHVRMWGVDPSYAGPHCENFCRSPSAMAYCGQYDNLLYFFAFLYRKIHSYYDHDDLKAYKRPL